MRGLVSDSALPRILAIADRPGWAIESKARNLARDLADRYEVVVRFQHEVTGHDLESADLVVIFYWLEIRKMPLPESALARCADRLLIGICSHFELQGGLREQGLATLNRLARCVFANNAALQREFAPLIDVPVHYTPNGVDTTFFRPGDAPRVRVPGELRVGWAGSLTNQGAEHRGFPNVIEPAVAAVPGVTLVTAIREQHWRNRDEMLAFYRDIDVYVCASRSEGTPNPCLEAAACGVPVVTTKVGNMPELIVDGENGCFFDGTAHGLAEKLALLRDSPALASQWGTRIRASIEAWDWRHQSENYARMFDAMLATRDPGSAFPT
ncbi:glycosyltransferase family 4 protein [Lysobacter fragariae]